MKTKTTHNDLLGLTERHVSQIIRRKMISKVKPSKLNYDRKNNKKIIID
jgi:hypothetical protein